MTNSKNLYVLPKIRTHSLMTVALIAASMISTADAAVSCSSSSPECCWVVRSWQLMGKTTSVSSTSSTACCSMFGVICSGSNVTLIDWTSQSLTGSIPADIGNLVNLGNLRLDFNKLTGWIPSTIGKLVNLKELYLQKNDLNGSIPSSIGNLVKLKRIYIQGNQLSGSIPSSFGNLVNLERIQMQFNQLSGSIPSSMGNFVNLLRLWLQHNQLQGSIPSSIGNIVKLQSLSVSNNPDLLGTLKPQCNTNVSVSLTNIIICGCLSKSTPPNIYPPKGTPDACLSSGSALSLQKRAQAFSQTIGGYKYTCNTDANLNPYADCLNSMAKICNSSDTATFKKSICQNGVNQMFGNMSTYWINVRQQCGQWPYNGVTGNKDNPNCSSANTALQKNAYYLVWNPLTSVYDRLPVTVALTNSINVRLWGNPALK